MIPFIIFNIYKGTKIYDGFNNLPRLQQKRFRFSDFLSAMRLSHPGKLSSLMSAAITSTPNPIDSQLPPVTSAEKNGDACTSETLLPGQAGSQVKLTNAAPAFSGYEPITASDSPAQPASPTQIVKDKELSQATAAVLAMGGMGHPWFRYLRE